MGNVPYLPSYKVWGRSGTIDDLPTSPHFLFPLYLCNRLVVQRNLPQIIRGSSAILVIDQGDCWAGLTSQDTWKQLNCLISFTLVWTGIGRYEALLIAFIDFQRGEHLRFIIGQQKGSVQPLTEKHECPEWSYRKPFTLSRVTPHSSLLPSF